VVTVLVSSILEYVGSCVRSEAGFCIERPIGFDADLKALAIGLRLARAYAAIACLPK